MELFTSIIIEEGPQILRADLKFETDGILDEDGCITGIGKVEAAWDTVTGEPVEITPERVKQALENYGDSPLPVTMTPPEVSLP